MIPRFSSGLARLSLGVAVAALASTSSCMDPVQTDAESALGGEINGERPGPTHRAGQPCTVCHSEHGSQSPAFVVAGTVFERRGQTAAAPNVTVVITDVVGSTFATSTNRVGNFFVTANEWQPTFPLFVELQTTNANGEAVTKAMKTRIGRDGGCAVCHRGNGDASHMPAVFLKDFTDP